LRFPLWTTTFSGDFGEGGRAAGGGLCTVAGISIFCCACLRAMVAFLAAALAFAACTRTAFRFSLLDPALKDTNEIS